MWGNWEVDKNLEIDYKNEFILLSLFLKVSLLLFGLVHSTNSNFKMHKKN